MASQHIVQMTSHCNPYSHRTYFLLFISLLQIGVNPAIPTKNKYETDSDTFWMSTSKFTPIQGSSYAGVRRRKSMYLSLKFEYYGKTAWDKWENILRIGEYGYGNDSGCYEHGNRYPALFILPSNNGLQISLSDALNCWFVVEHNYNLQENIIYFLTINYNQTYSAISMSTLNASNNDIIEPLRIIANASRTNDDTLLGRFMDIIISDPLTSAANVLLFDIVVISYDDILTFPGTTNVPTTMPPRPDDNDFGVEVTVAMDYSSNNTNKSDTDEVIREITEDIMNEYMDKLANSSNATLHVVISNLTEEYDIVLSSNFTTDNVTAVRLEAMFESELETELIKKLNANNGSITIQNIQIEVTVIDRSIDSEVEPDVISTQSQQTTETALVSLQKDNMQLIWFIVIVSGFVMFCIFMIGFFIGVKCNFRPKKIESRPIRVKSNANSEDNVRMYAMPVDKEKEVLNIRNTMLEVLGTPSGINVQAVNNNIIHIHLNQSDNMDENDDEDDEDEDMYNDENTNSKYSKLYTNMTQQITEGTVPVRIPYYRN